MEDEVRGRRVLVVDDDPKFRAFAKAGLEEYQMSCETAAGAREALEKLDAHEPFDVVLLDIMMPESSGWEVMERLRERGDDLAVVFVTARDGVPDRVRGLRMGADDYVVKPFAFAELVARIGAVLRRRRRGRWQIGRLSVDPDHREARIGDRVVELTPREFDLLRVLMQAEGAVVSKPELLRQVWRIHHDPGTNVVEVHVARLRRKLGEEGGAAITTVRGMGYALRPRERDPA